MIVYYLLSIQVIIVTNDLEEILRSYLNFMEIAVSYFDVNYYSLASLTCCLTYHFDTFLMLPRRRISSRQLFWAHHLRQAKPLFMPGYF